MYFKYLLVINITCKKSLTKLLARLEFGPGTSYNGQSCPDVNKASISRI